MAKEQERQKRGCILQGTAQESVSTEGDVASGPRISSPGSAPTRKWIEGKRQKTVAWVYGLSARISVPGEFLLSVVWKCKLRSENSMGKQAVQVPSWPWPQWPWSAAFFLLSSRRLVQSHFSVLNSQKRISIIQGETRYDSKEPTIDAHHSCCILGESIRQSRFCDF